MSDTTTVFHPTIENVSQPVPADAVAEWQEQGWCLEDPALADEPKPGSKDALVAQAETLGLSTEGTKAELEQRIAEANEPQ